jgi:hypothetical protein
MTRCDVLKEFLHECCVETLFPGREVDNECGVSRMRKAGELASEYSSWPLCPAFSQQLCECEGS